MLFSDIICNNKTKSKLLKIAHSYPQYLSLLLHGPQGNSKLALALALATYLNCNNKQVNDSCGICQSCSMMKSFTHPDLLFSFPIGKTKEVKGKNLTSKEFLTSWRKFIAEKLWGDIFEWSSYLNEEPKTMNIPKEEAIYIKNYMSLKAFYGKYKIVIIWLPEYMNINSANALLKLIEEPPENSIFMLVTENINSILPTIKSRLQQHYIPKFTDEEIIGYVCSNYKLDNEEAKKIASISSGNLNKANKIANQSYDKNLLEMFIKWMRVCYVNKYIDLLKEAAEFNNMAPTQQKNFFINSLNIMRHVIIFFFNRDNISFLIEKEGEFIKKFVTTLTISKAIEIVNILEKGYLLIDRNANPKLLFLSLSTEISKIFKTKHH
jgi:DNA polymerase-3 subunit delta'